MSVKVSFHQLQQRLPEVLDEIDKTGQEYVVQRDGKDCAVLISARRWRRRTVSESLDAFGSAYRLSRAKQARAERLLATKQERSLSVPERRELQALLRESDAILLRRAAAMDRLP
jgi:antitoxin (DNA-binding transcriptional repressor) of toxin-antitoxin stability system